MSIHDKQQAKDWRTSLLVLQATPFCNLDCSYCYLADRQDKSKMSLPTLEKILQRFFSSGLAAEKSDYYLACRGTPRNAYRILPKRRRLI